MPVYEYSCNKCGSAVNKFFPMGEAEKVVLCECESEAVRVFSSNFVIKGHSPSQSFKRNAQMTKLNEEAGHRCRKEHEPGLKLAALDYGDGDVREVKKDPIMESIGESIGK